MNATPSPNVSKQIKAQAYKKQELNYVDKTKADSSKNSNCKKLDNNSAYLPELDCDGSFSICKKKLQLEKEINKIFSDKLPEIRLSIFK